MYEMTEGDWRHQRLHMRVGRKLGRTLYLYDPDRARNYDTDMVIGMVDSRELAVEICRRWNEEGGSTDG